MKLFFFFKAVGRMHPDSSLLDRDRGADLRELHHLSVLPGVPHARRRRQTHRRLRLLCRPEGGNGEGEGRSPLSPGRGKGGGFSLVAR